jgi:hypothetical protein
MSLAERLGQDGAFFAARARPHHEGTIPRPAKQENKRGTDFLSAGQLLNGIGQPLAFLKPNRQYPF